MKTIKQLDELLNKVVEFNQPNVAQYKGFLYKNTYGYYIKVIDSIIGSQTINDQVYLNDGDETYITHALKPKLMIVSKKSWHYKLIKFVLKDNAPTPKTMQNGCPYFWLLIFSILILPFLFLGKAIVWLLLLIPKGYIQFLEFLSSSWFSKLDANEALDYLHNRALKIPLPTKLYINHNKKYKYTSFDHDFMTYFILEKYNIDRDKNSLEFLEKQKEIENNWREWRKEINKVNAEKRIKEIEIENKRSAKHIKYLQKKAIEDAKWNARIEPIVEGLNKILNSIGSIFSSIRNQFKTNPNNWKNIIKRTKQFVGAIITLFLLILTYYFVNSLVFVITFLIDFLIAQWLYVAFIGIIGVLAGLIYIMVLFFTGWAQNIVNKYRKGKRVWYIEPFKLLCIYIIFYPIKYIVIVIGYALLFIIWKPIELIFYRIFWNLILFPVGKWLGNKIGRCVVSLYNALISSTGIFGEYVGSSYTEYCPGLEFQDFDEED